MCLAGCGGTKPKLPDALDPTLASAFAPTALRLSPLTRLETGTDGKPELAVYFELTDNWGHSTKAPGIAQVQLYRLGGVSSDTPASTPATVSSVSAANWAASRVHSSKTKPSVR